MHRIVVIGTGPLFWGCSESGLPNPCGDGVRDNAETDVDCGGSQCPACAPEFAPDPPSKLDLELDRRGLGVTGEVGVPGVDFRK